MKQSEIVIGNSYLFYRTEIVHRKDLIGTIVKIVGKKKRGKGKLQMHSNYLPQITGGYWVYKTDMGRKVNCCELKELPAKN